MYKSALIRFCAAGALAVLTAQTAQAAQMAGVAGAVRGDVVLVASLPTANAAVVGRNLDSGDRIFLGDEISTGPDSGLQIMLLDETVFTIGPDAGLVIDEFVYDPATSAGKVTASVVKGAFRFVSGRVAKEEPRNMNVRTPAGTIGIRGTSAAGRVVPADPATPGSTPSATFVLLGPGIDNNAGERAGRIIVSNAGGSVEITRSGFGTTVGAPNLPPVPPLRLDPAQVAGLTGGLGTDGGARPQANTPGTTPGSGTQGAPASRGEQQAQGGTPATVGPGPAPAVGASRANSLTGQNLGAGVTSAGFLGQVGETSTQANRQTLAAAEDIGNSGSGGSTAIATFDQLRLIQTGTATFDFGTVNLNHISGPHTNSGGSYEAVATIDFGARTIDLDVTNVSYFFNGGTAHTFTFDPDGQNGGALDNTYANDTGSVAETWNSQSRPDNYTTLPTDGSTAQVEAAILNNTETGVIAAQGFVSVTVTDANNNKISGSNQVARQ